MAVNDSFQNLIEDITQQVLERVQQQVQSTVVELINSQLTELVSEDTVRSIVVSRVQERIQDYTPNLDQFEAGLQTIGTQILSQLNSTADRQVNDLVTAKVSSLDIDTMVGQVIASKLDATTNYFPFKDRSISGSAIDPEKLRITGDNITGGVITNFASTGIDDKSTMCQLTILDQGAVFENTVYAPKIEVKGGAVIDGDLTILGNITDNPAYQKLVSDVSTDAQTSIGPTVLDAYQDRVFERIREEGLDLNKITINGQSVVEGDKLTSVVRHSQLQSVGVIRDLQTDGEALLSQTLYISNRRVGVNTMDPNTALSVWDEEIEIGIGKQSQGIARIGTARDHTLVIGTNKQDNITLTPDGETTIPKLRIGNMLFSSSSTPPQYNSPRGTVVFNEQPSLGGPLGWISLGDARWANFGIID
jgi:hypothetical protein